MGLTTILDQAKSKFQEILVREDLSGASVTVQASPLSAEDAIGHPRRRDFPIIEGKEMMIEAKIFDAKGQAFTDSPGNFNGSLETVVNLPLVNNRNRAIFTAAMNAVLRHLGTIDGTVHCRDEDPEKCSRETAAQILAKYGKIRVGLIGLNPAMAQSLAETFGAEEVFITDLNRQQIGETKFGIEVWDGRDKNDLLIERSDVVVVTGTTLVNGSFDAIYNSIQRDQKAYLIYGVTCAGVCKLLALNRICLYGREN